MQMNMIEANLTQRGSLPLPSAALVIDIRGIGDDDVIDRLRIEIMDLASEMEVYEINHWRFLTRFLSFTSIGPLRIEDIETIHKQQKNAGKQEPPKSKGNLVPNKAPQTGLIGNIDPPNQRHAPSPYEGEENEYLSEENSFAVFQQNIEEISNEINRIRNNRIAAVTDLNKSGIPGRSVKDATVRVIFLTEADNQESLASAAAYAAKLKEHFRKLERENHQSMISTTVLCLNNSGEAGPPTKLIHGLRWNDDWKHIDSLLISEQFREDAALIEGRMQTHLAELLLYVVLIIPPLTVTPSSNGESQPIALLEEGGTPPPKGKWIHLPAATYLVGMAAIEHSGRWGRRWLNYGIAARAIEILQSNEPDEDLARKRIRSVVDAWLRSWFRQIAQAIPDKIPGHIPALNAISGATAASSAEHNVITSQSISPSMGRTTLRELRNYLTELVSTYTGPVNEDDTVQRSILEPSEDPTLQDAIDSIPHIQQRLREWEDRDPALKKGTPLVNAQLEAQRVLSDPNFFTGVKGSIPRARLQLKALGTVISDFRNAHEQNGVNLTKMRENLEKSGTTLINDLEEHVRNIPLLATRLRLQFPIALLTFLLILCLGVFTAFFSVAWIRHLIYVNWHTLPLDSVLFVNRGTPFLAYVFWGILIILLLALIIALGSSLFRKKRTGMEVEATFVITLLVCSIALLLLSVSPGWFDGDPLSFGLLTWLAPAEPVGSICLILAIIVLLVECACFWWWRNHLLAESTRIVNELKATHQKDIKDVTDFITEAVGLEILMRTELTDGKGGPGAYYARVDQLHKRLIKMAEQASKQQALAARRLAMSVSETQPGTAPSSTKPWLNLKIRDEWLDVNSLADGYKRLHEQLSKEGSALQEFSELLLRVMGEETAIEVEQQFRDRNLGSREQRQIRVFLTMLIAVATRYSIAPQSMTSLTPIIERYENIDSQYVYQQPAVGALIETLNKKSRQTIIQPPADGQDTSGWAVASVPDTAEANTALATNAFAAWAQMLWENTDARLDKALTSTGVLAKLMENDEYDPRAVMRRLQERTALFGRSISNEQAGELRLILSPSAQSRAFRQSLNIPSRFIIDFPDIERLLLLYIQRYKAEPLFISEPVADQK